MSEYIWIDTDGNVLKKEAKGRGRCKAGFEERDDGNYYLVSDAFAVNEIKTAAPPKPEKSKVIVNTDYNDEEEEQDYSKFDEKEDEDIDNSAPTELSIDRVKCFKEPNKIKLKDFLKCCFVDVKDFIISDDKIILNNMILTGNPGLINLSYNSLYQKIEIDTKENTIKVWDVTKMWQNQDTKEWFPDPSGPSFFIKNLFSSFERE